MPDQPKKVTELLTPYLTDTDSWYIFPGWSEHERRLRTDWRYRWRQRLHALRYWWDDRPWRDGWRHH